jgi:hypothetical protein
VIAKPTMAVHIHHKALRTPNIPSDHHAILDGPWHDLPPMKKVSEIINIDDLTDPE